MARCSYLQLLRWSMLLQGWAVRLIVNTSHHCMHCVGAAGIKRSLPYTPGRGFLGTAQLSRFLSQFLLTTVQHHKSAWWHRCYCGKRSCTSGRIAASFQQNLERKLIVSKHRTMCTCLTGPVTPPSDFMDQVIHCFSPTSCTPEIHSKFWFPRVLDKQLHGV